MAEDEDGRQIETADFGRCRRDQSFSRCDVRVDEGRPMVGDGLRCDHARDDAMLKRLGTFPVDPTG